MSFSHSISFVIKSPSWLKYDLGIGEALFQKRLPYTFLLFPIRLVTQKGCHIPRYGKVTLIINSDGGDAMRGCSEGRQTQFGLHYQTASPFQVIRDFIRDGKLIMISDWIVRNKWQIGFAVNASSPQKRIQNKSNNPTPHHLNFQNDDARTFCISAEPIISKQHNWPNKRNR